jgi:hypothetical protein
MLGENMPMSRKPGAVAEMPARGPCCTRRLLEAAHGHANRIEHEVLHQSREGFPVASCSALRRPEEAGHTDAAGHAEQPAQSVLVRRFDFIERTADCLRRLLLEVWSARPTTAILVTHNPREAILLADQLVLLAPRPTHAVAVVQIAIPRAKRDATKVEEIYADLLKGYPANFATD